MYAAQQYGTSYFGQPDNSGFFGPFNKCQYQSGGYIKNCGPTVKYQIQGNICWHRKIKDEKKHFWNFLRKQDNIAGTAFTVLY